MFRWIKDVWGGSEPIEFASSYDLAESVVRLKAATRRWSFFNLSDEVAVGRVSESRVSLKRVIPMVGNSFKPVFVGRFEQDQGKVVLAGRFTLSLFVKIFMAYWVGFCALFVVISLAAGAHSPVAALMVLAGIGMLILGPGMARLFAWFSRNDPAWLSEVIRSALHVQASPGEGIASELPVLSGNAKPRLIVFATGLFTLLGVVCLASALRILQPDGIPSDGSFMARYPDAFRVAVILNGALLLACAYGIYRRYLLAWWAGFVVLLVGQFSSCVNFLSSHAQGDARDLAIFLYLGSIIIVIIWGRWWYLQRVRFH